MLDALPGPTMIQDYMDSPLSETIQEQAWTEHCWELISSPSEIPPSHVNSCSTKGSTGTSSQDPSYHLVENGSRGQIDFSSFLVEKGQFVPVVHHEFFKNFLKFLKILI
ncbi:hypothetical protein P9112_011390 [Eukaryota sp. TZLM1-RC]